MTCSCWSCRRGVPCLRSRVRRTSQLHSFADLVQEHRSALDRAAEQQRERALADALGALFEADMRETPPRRAVRVRARASEGQGGWLSVAEVAERLGRHVVTVRRDLTSGRLPGVRVGRSWRVRAADLDELLSEQQRRQVAQRQDAQRVSQAREAQRARARAARAARRAV